MGEAALFDVVEGAIEIGVKAISAYALYTRKLMGDLDIEKGIRSLKEWGGAEKVNMETDGFVLLKRPPSDAFIG